MAITLSEQTNPGTPPTNQHRLYFNSNGLLSEIDDSGIIHIMEGWDNLGSIVLGANAVTTGVLTIPVRTRLMIMIFIAGYGGSDIASLRFNGDSGNNYWDRHITIAAGGTTLTNTQNTSTSLIRLAGNSVNQGRVVTCQVMNIANRSKPVNISVQTLTGAAGTVGIIDSGAGEWVNTSNQITSIEMLTAGGSVTLLTGTGFIVFGSNF